MRRGMVTVATAIAAEGMGQINPLRLVKQALRVCVCWAKFITASFVT